MTTTDESPRRDWQRRLVAVVTVCVFSVGSGALLFQLTSGPSDVVTAQQHQQPIDNDISGGIPRRRLGEDCEKTCKDPPLKDHQHFDGDDLMDYSKMLERLKKYRKEWINNKLYKDYGKNNYMKMFEPEEETEDGKKQRVSVGRNRIFKDANDLPQYVLARQKARDEQAKRMEENEKRAAKAAEKGETVAPTEEEKEILEPVGHAGWERFVTKWKMKILQTQIGIVSERENAKAICIDECGKSDEAGERQRFLGKAQVPKSTGLYTKFTWATGGHSASAGHGNFFRESYTANLKRALKPLLKEIGIDFEARNYAMGGTDCAEEIALCMNSIFGRDFDAISWDYGMTDGHELYKMLMYAYKAAGLSQLPDGFSQPGNIPHRPAFFALHQNDRNNQIVKGMYELGMTALSMDGKYLKEVIYEALPDMMGMSDDEIANQPPYVQYLKCDGGIETNEPGCKDHKFNNTFCNKRRARTSWHPGWKDHALKGNLIAMTILDAMEDALEGLMDMAKDATIPADESLVDIKKRLTDQLRGMDVEEKKRYDNIFEQPIPENLMNHVKGWWNEGRDEHMSGVEISDFYKQTSFCHSAILPSQARFQGLVNENFTKVGEVEDQNYDEGISSHLLGDSERPNRRTGKEPKAMVNPAGEGKLMMVRDDDGRQVCEEDYLNLDYKDYFFVSSLEGWQSVVIPNDSEKKVYKEFDGKKAKGYVLLCMVRCDWGRCAEGDLHYYFGWMRPKPRKGEEAPNEEEMLAKYGRAEVTINGEPVTEAADMRNCFALRNKQGPIWKPDAEGRYEIKIRVTGGSEYAYIRPGSFILV